MEKRKIIFIALFASLLMATVLPVKGENRKTYIRQYKALAIREMERTGIPASIKLAQGILESAGNMKRRRSRGLTTASF